MKKSIRDFDLNNKKVIIRCDFNVPIKDGVITDDTRLIASLETIQYAISNKAKVILLSHLGRIKNVVDLEKNSLEPVASKLAKLLNHEVIFSRNNEEHVIDRLVNDLKQGDVLLLENTRFQDLNNESESKNSEELGKYWASLGDIFINDAFGTSHRKHASNYGIAANLPSGIGFLIEKELKALSSAIIEPKRPYTVILGGAKVADKILVIKNLLEKADYLLIGGGMSYTFLKAKGLNIGNSLLDEENIPFAKEILDKYPDKIILPIDFKCCDDFDNPTNYIKCDNEIPNGYMSLDIGEKTLSLFKKYIDNSKTVFWNGPVGVFEKKEFQTGTIGICEILKNSSCISIIGGGDSASAIKKLGYEKDVTYISTGGGASLEFIEGKILPGIDCIDNK